MKHLLIKTLTWRIIGIIPLLGVVFLFTSDWGMLLGAGLFDLVSRTVLYFGHEYAWLRWERRQNKQPTV